jgi:hypothetical protein
MKNEFELKRVERKVLANKEESKRENLLVVLEGNEDSFEQGRLQRSSSHNERNIHKQLFFSFFLLPPSK